MLADLLRALRPHPAAKLDAIRAALIGADCHATSMGHVSALVNGKTVPTAEEWQTITSHLGAELCARGFATICGATITAPSTRTGDALTDAARGMQSVAAAVSAIVEADADGVHTEGERTKVIVLLDDAASMIAAARTDALAWRVQA